MLDIKAGENGRELQKGDKYDWKQEDDTYTLIINNPQMEDDGIYLNYLLFLIIYNLFQARTSSW
jgi:hypothetical protein